MAEEEKYKGRVRFLEADVYIEAKKRIAHLYDVYDHCFILFSGGKDSLAVLKLVEEHFVEKGWLYKKKINVIYKDNELIPDCVNDFIETFRVDPKYDFQYWCAQQANEKQIMGKAEMMVEWDSRREHIHLMPSFALTTDRVVTAYELDSIMCAHVNGRVAYINGVRAQESPTRLQSVLQVGGAECYIGRTADKRIFMCKPIYDWSEKDVFYYFYDKKIKYSFLYDLQAWNRQLLRTSTPLHPNAIPQIYKLKTLDPVFYERLTKLFPDVLLAARYIKEYDKYGVIDKYERSVEGLFKCIRDCATSPRAKKWATTRTLMALRRREKKMANGSKNFGGYPLLYLFIMIVSGRYMKYSQIPAHLSPSKDMIDFEMGEKTPITVEAITDVLENTADEERRVN
jgi:3'-phosphoadenosine 5'-phosphosulfate sulfotransferase (PAPS reductase)/FAD synthetase